MLTAADQRLIDQLRKPEVRTIGAKRIQDLLDVLDRCDKTTRQEVKDAHRGGLIEATALRMAAHGIASAEDIKAKGLPNDLRDECLHLRQQHDDAIAYRGQQAAVPTDVINEPVNAAN